MSDLTVKKQECSELVASLLARQKEYEGKSMPPDVGDKWITDSKKAEELQNEIKAIEDREKKAKELDAFNRQLVNDPVTPVVDAPSRPIESKGSVAGYISLGEAVTLSAEYEDLARRDFPRGEFKLFAAPELEVGSDGKAYVPLNRTERKHYEEAIETKAIPTVGAGVIEPQRLAVMPKVTEDDQLRLRDVMTVGRTSAAAVQYVRFESQTRAAAPVAAGAAKPEATLALTLQTATVEVLAVWIPVQVQQLSDVGQLRSLIDDRLRYDLRKVEEEQIMYGDGSTPDLQGILTVAGTHDIAVSDARVTGTPTLIDQVRVGMTDVRVAGYEPNALAIHPYDWEEIVLQKGSDEHYLAQVFPDNEGNMRVWGLRVVETVATEATAGVATEERNMIVGDFRRGSTLFVREDISVQVGMANDDFIKNLRRILAEERVAHAIFAPKAYAILTTQASAT